MKAKSAATFVMLFLAMTAFFGQLGFSVIANAFIPTPNTHIIILEPKDTVYANSTIILKFNVTEAFRACTFSFSIDYSNVMYNVDNLNVTRNIDLAPGYNNLAMYQGADFAGSAVLHDLPDGQHHVTVYQIGGYDPTGPNPYQWQQAPVKSETVFFTVDRSNEIPTISIVYPTNGTVVNALMGWFVASWQYPANATFSWVGYSLNGTSWTPGGNHTVTGQNETRLFIGNDGDYTFSLYANDTAGNWATPQTVTFHIHIVGDELEYYKVAGIDIRALAFAVIILILFALAVLVAYKRHRKITK